MLQFLGLSCHFDGQFLNLERQLFDFSLISPSVFLKSQVILFLLSGSKSPLLEFLLVPVHLELVLVHFFIRLEN